MHVNLIHKFQIIFVYAVFYTEAVSYTDWLSTSDSGKDLTQIISSIVFYVWNSETAVIVNQNWS